MITSEAGKPVGDDRIVAEVRGVVFFYGPMCDPDLGCLYPSWMLASGGFAFRGQTDLLCAVCALFPLRDTNATVGLTDRRHQDIAGGRRHVGAGYKHNSGPCVGSF